MTESSDHIQSMRKSYACDECKRRKIRCSGGDRCSNCSKDARNCQYTSTTQKFSTLQRRLRESEIIRQDMEKLWKIHLPEVDLKVALERMRENRADIKHSATSNYASQLPNSMMQGDALEQPPMALREHSNAEDFEFDESRDLDRSIDGMAFLTSDPHKAGYTGPPSGIAALKFLHSLPPYLPVHYASPLTNAENQEYPDVSNHSQSSINRYIDAYFTLYHPAYPILHEGTFRARYNGALAKPRDGSWPLLYNSVLAIGAFVDDSNSTKCDIPFFTEARRHLTMDLLEKGSLSYVQAIVLLANYLQKRNKPNAGFILIGIAFSMALAIGLHREFDTSTTSPFTMEIRRRAWWTLYVFVSGSQLALGRPAASLVGVNVQLPTNVNDIDLSVDMDDLPEGKSEPTTSSCLIEQVKLTKIANTTQGELLTYLRPSFANAQRLEESIQSWWKQLPPYFSQDVTLEPCLEFPKRILLWRSFNLRIILNRPFLFEAIAKGIDLDASTGPISTCLTAADECIASVCGFLASVREVKRGFAWYATTWLITACFVQATCLIYDRNHSLASSWETSLWRSLDCLQFLGSSHDLAIRARGIIQQALDYMSNPDAYQNITFPIDANELLRPEATPRPISQGMGMVDTAPSVYSARSGPDEFEFFNPDPSDPDFLRTPGGMMYGNLFDLS